MSLQSVVIEADMFNLKSAMDSLAADLPAIAAPVAAAGAKVVYERVKANVRSMGKKTGNLERSIYRKLSEERSDRARGRIIYHISWNHKTAPHGRLLEWGWWQRYQTLIDSKGKWVTAVRPEARGKKRPGRWASQAVKDAYFVPLKGGPKYRPGYAFVRRAQDAFPDAIRAMSGELSSQLAQRLGAM